MKLKNSMPNVFDVKPPRLDLSKQRGAPPIVGASPNSSNMLPIIAAAGNMLSNIFAGYQQRKAQQEANQTNIMLARQANDLNYKMFKEQNAYNREMYDLNNAYNTPLAQRNRLEEAGINPAIALGQISTGTATASTSGQHNPAVVPNVMPEDGLARGLSNSVDSAISSFMNFKNLSADLDIKRQQAERLRLENLWYGRRTGADIANVEANTRILNLDQEIKNQSFNEILATYPERITEIKARVAHMVNQSELMRLDVDIKKGTGKQLAEAQLLQVRTSVRAALASAALMYKQGIVAEKTAERLVQQKLKDIQDTRGVTLNNNLLQSAFGSHLSRIRAEAQRAQSDADIRDYDNSIKEFNTIFDAAMRVGDLVSPF